MDRCTSIENCQGGTERSLGEELASPKTPSRILPVPSTGILENDWASMYIGQNRGKLKSLHAANELLRMIKCRPLCQALAFHPCQPRQKTRFSVETCFSISLKDGTTSILNQIVICSDVHLASIQTRALGGATNVAQSKLTVLLPRIQNQSPICKLLCHGRPSS